jgi:hypothetical protein
MEINEFCKTCIYDGKNCGLSPLTLTVFGGALCCPGKRSIYESEWRKRDTCDICGEKFTDSDYATHENVICEIRYPIVYNNISELRIFDFNVHKRCCTLENQEMLSQKVAAILEESTIR